MTEDPKKKMTKIPPIPLATRGGVGPSRTVLPVGSWKTIFEYLVAQFSGVSSIEWKRRMSAGEVVDEYGVPVTEHRPHEANLGIFYYRTIEVEDRIPFEEKVLFQDDHLVVADKPHFLPVIPSGRFVQETLLVRLKKKLAIDTLAPIHRIDSGTAGIVVFCIKESERDAYQALFRLREVEKCYEAVGVANSSLKLPMTYESRLVQDEHFMRMREESGNGAPNSLTHIELLAARGQHALYRLRPVTGRKHQLRVHCAALGIAIVNDPMYPIMQPKPADDAPRDYSRPLQLLARSIDFRDPITRLQRKFVSERNL
ncbi:MAG: pseudouridine synthase [Planctomycetota bacterium]|nr:pseudouridine synthase [Planctomycetota bacterium]